MYCIVLYWIMNDSSFWSRWGSPPSFVLVNTKSKHPFHAMLCYAMLCYALRCTALHSLTVKIPFSIPLLNFLNTPLMIPLSLPPSLHPSPYHTIGASQLRMVEICQPCNDVASVMTGSKVRSRPFIYWFIYLLNVHRDIYLKRCCLTYLIFLFYLYYQFIYCHARTRSVLCTQDEFWWWKTSGEFGWFA